MIYMNIRELYVKQGRTIRTLSFADNTPEEIRSFSALNTSFFIDVEKDAETVVTVNLSHLMLETIIGQCTTWNEIGTLLTGVMVDSYSTDIPNLDNPKFAVRTTDPLKAEEFEVGYTCIDTPEDRNVKIFRDRLIDLVITKHGEGPINLDTSLCFVNGLVSRPIMYKGEMLVSRGAEFFSASSKLRHPDIMLMDFKELGDIEIVPFSECRIKYRNKKNTPDLYSDMEFILPEQVDLRTSVVFPVFAYSMYFPNVLTAVTHRSLVVNHADLSIGRSLLNAAYSSANYLNQSYVMEAEAIEKYVYETMSQKDHYGAFFVIVKHPSIWIKEEPLCKFAGDVESGLVRDGILFNAAMQSFMSYNRMMYNDITDVYHTPLPSILEIDTNKNGKGALALESTRCLHAGEYLQDHSTGQFSMIKIMKL